MSIDESGLTLLPLDHESGAHLAAKAMVGERVVHAQVLVFSRAK
jgi:hypothetical protein